MMVRFALFVAVRTGARAGGGREPTCVFAAMDPLIAQAGGMCTVCGVLFVYLFALAVAAGDTGADACRSVFRCTCPGSCTCPTGICARIASSRSSVRDRSHPQTQQKHVRRVDVAPVPVADPS